MFVEVMTIPLALNKARLFFGMWTGNLVFVLLLLGVSVMHGSGLGIVIGIFNLAVSTWMTKTAARRYADAKHREEKAEWERSMYEEWSRA